jgi:hypothetical protein
MSEQVFPSGDWITDDDWATMRVAGLAESVLEEMIEPEHDWPRLREQTMELDSVAAVMAKRYPQSGDAITR